MSTRTQAYDRLTLEWLDDEGHWNLVPGVSAHIGPGDRSTRQDRLCSMNGLAYYLTQESKCAVRVMLDGEGLPPVLVIRRNADGDVERESDDNWNAACTGAFWCDATF
jgi:hypothetical protein